MSFINISTSSPQSRPSSPVVTIGTRSNSYIMLNNSNNNISNNNSLISNNNSNNNENTIKTTEVVDTNNNNNLNEEFENEYRKEIKDEEKEIQRYEADSIVFQFTKNTNSLILEDYVDSNDEYEENNNQQQQDKNKKDQEKQEISNEDIEFDTAVNKFLELSDNSSNLSENQTDSKERTLSDSFIDFTPNYYELYHEMIVVLYKDKIICRPINNNNSNNNNNNNNNGTGSPSASATDINLSTDCLVIDRQTCSLSIQNFSNVKCGSATELPSMVNMTGSGGTIVTPNGNMITAYGIVGILNLLSGPYLILITSRNVRGNLRGKLIYEIDSTQMVLIPTGVELGEHEKRLESTYKRSLNNLLRSNFYFSYDLDISNSLQRNSVMNQFEPINHLYQMFDDRFYWNKNLQQPFIEKELYGYILPLIRGYVDIYQFFIDGDSYNYSIISRRSKYRAGTRYNTRGSDANGNVANYVETEQILQSITRSKTFSFIQTRGSIPLVWEQNGMRIKPVIKINPDHTANLSTFNNHFKEQISFYGPQTIVTLLDQKGSETFLGESYQQTLQLSVDLQSNIDYVAFDFHHFCQGNRFDKVDILISSLDEKLKKIGYLEKDPTGYLSYQNGSVRTNCLDCLDRTNLVQSMIGLNILEKQLASIGYNLNSKDTTPLLKQVKLAWANNGDAISQQYAGTSALKGDFTRTGKRNTKGVFRDGVNSLSRYYINTFLDKLRQISIDMFLGNITVETNRSNIIENQNESDWGESRMNAISYCVDHFLVSEKDAQQGFVNAWIVISINKRNQEQERILLLTPTHLVRCKYNFNDNRIVHYKKYAVSGIKRIQKGSILTDGGKKASYGMRIYYENNKSTQSSSSSSSSKKSPTNSSSNVNSSKPISIGNANSTSSPDLYNEISTSNIVIHPSEVKDYTYQTFIVPIPQGETIEFSKDVISEMADTIKDTAFTGSGGSQINTSNFIVEQDFKRKSSTFSAAYNGLKLGFYSKSPTVGSKGSLSQTVID